MRAKFLPAVRTEARRKAQGVACSERRGETRSQVRAFSEGAVTYDWGIEEGFVRKEMFELGHKGWTGC